MHRNIRRKNTPKTCVELQRTLGKKKKTGSFKTTDFKTYYKTTLTKTVRH